MKGISMRVKADLTGKRFGHLVVTEAVRNEKGELLWRCVCDCGNMTNAKTGHLNAGSKISCGCSMIKRKQDLTGKRFGRLIVLGNSGKKDERKHSVLWNCRCDCGNLCLKPTSELNAGQATSCGCAWRRSLIYAGGRFGRLTALEPTDKRIRRAVVWKCQCDCGNTIEVRSIQLQNGKVKSCGCIKSEVDKVRFVNSLTYVDDTCIEFVSKINVPTKASTTGVRGVTLCRNGRYKAELTFQKKRHYLGSYASLEEAGKARKQAEIMVEEYLENRANG